MSAGNFPATKRRWFRFSLGTLLIGTTILGTFLGLSMKEYRRVQSERELLQRIRAAGGEIGTEMPYSLFNARTYLRRVFGDDGFAVEHVFHATTRRRRITDEDLQLLTELPRLKRIVFTGPSFTDKSLSSIRDCRAIKALILEETEVTEAGLRQLQSAPNVERVKFRGSTINDSTLGGLSAFPNLKILELSETSVTDRGLDNLKYVPQLNALFLSDVSLLGPGIPSLLHLEWLSLISCTF